MSLPAAANRNRPGPSATTLMGLFLAALGLRLFHVWLVGAEQETPGLSFKYQAAARHLLEGDGFWLQVGPAAVPFCDRLPGYVVLLASMMGLVGASSLALVFAHAFIGAAQAPVLALLAARLGGSRAGLLAGLLVAAWVPSWKADVQLMETGATGLALALLLLALARARDDSRLVPILLVGLAATAAFLLRPDAMLVPAVAAAILSVQARSLRAALVVVGLPAIVALPWALRNARVADGAFVSVGLGANLLGALGESITADRPLLDDRGVARAEGHDSLFWPEPLRRDRERVRLALGLIQRNPGGYARGCVKRIAVSLSLYQGRLWPWGGLPEDDLVAWRAANPGAPRHGGLFRATASWAASEPLLAIITLGWGPLLAVLAAAAAWRLRHRPRDLALVLALPVYALLVHVPLHAEPRYFMPFVGSLLVLVAVGLRPAPREPADPDGTDLLHDRGHLTRGPSP